MHDTTKDSLLKYRFALPITNMPTSMLLCPCQSQKNYSNCCQPLHQNQNAHQAEDLMRSRYSAYVLGLIDYLVATTLPSQQAALNIDSMKQWSTDSTWLGLTIDDKADLDTNHATVTFTATWQEHGETYSHQERSIFVLHNNAWYFIDPTVDYHLGRNDDCLCGSTKKFKKCCAPYLG